MASTKAMNRLFLAIALVLGGCSGSELDFGAYEVTCAAHAGRPPS